MVTVGGIQMAVSAVLALIVDQKLPPSLLTSERTVPQTRCVCNCEAGSNITAHTQCCKALDSDFVEWAIHRLQLRPRSNVPLIFCSGGTQAGGGSILCLDSLNDLARPRTYLLDLE